MFAHKVPAAYSLHCQLACIDHGKHVCMVYDDADEQLAVAVPYMADGLRNGDCCAYIADDLTVDQVKAALEGGGVDVRREIDRGALMLLTKREAYLRNNAFDPAEMIDFLGRAVDDAVARGFAGFRVTGEMTWALGGEVGCDRLAEYEALLNRFFPGSRASAICQYNRRRFSPEIVRDVLRTHPIAILGDQLCPNLFYEPPEFVLDPHAPGRVAQRVDWMIGQLKKARAVEQRLEAANEALVEKQTALAAELERRREAEAELARKRDELDQLVQHRTGELNASLKRLSLAERMAALGTLAAGLGHDLGNILMPLRVRLQTLEQMDLPESAQSEIRGVRDLAEYLRKLAVGLRHLVVDPSSGKGGNRTDLASWWSNTEGLLRTALPPRIKLHSELPDEPCCIAIPQAAITQAVFNLVQNAGDAMRRQEHGEIRVSAHRQADRIVLTVADNGPGMDEATRQRCMEPFFTTRNRDLSTGLGLTLVYTLVRDAGGSIDIQSRPGEGTTFTLDLPAAPAARPGGVRKQAVVDINDPRIRAFIAAELKQHAFDVGFDSRQIAAADMVVVEDGAKVNTQGCVVVVNKQLRVHEIRAAIGNALATVTENAA